MHAFTYHSPTEIVFGKDTQLQLAEQIRKYGGNRVLLVYGSGSIERSGLLNQLCQVLTEAQIPYELFGGAKANPTLEHAREGVKLALKSNADFVIGAGGGSVIDTAKAIAIGAANAPTDIWEFWTREKTPHHALPVGAVLTISAAGSESSDSAVLTNLATGVKRGLSTELNRPRFAIMNPELTMTLPPYQTASGCVDILMHTMERYFNQCDNMELTDGISESLMRTVMKNAKILKDEPANYDARAEVMWAGSLSHNGLTGCGTDGGDWATHKMEHEIGGLFDVAHGAGLAALWGSWARFVLDARPARFAQFATHVLGVTAGADDTETALKGIEAMEDFYHSINMPVSLSELGVTPTPEQIRTMAEKCDISTHHNAGKVKHLSVEDMVAIYTTAL